jgi:hypothetical protein
LLVVPRLGQEFIDRSTIDRVGDAVKIGIAAQHDADDVGIEVLHALQEFDTCHFGHALIGYDHGDPVARQQLESFGRAARGQDAIAIAAQHALQRRQYPCLVVDQQQRASFVVRARSRQRQLALIGDHPRAVADGQRRREVIPLHLVAAARREKGELRRRFDAFGNDAQAQASGHRDHGLRDQRGIRVHDDVLEKRAIDLERVEREALEMAQAAVAGSEVVDRQANAHRLEFGQRRGDALRMLHEHAFGHLHFDQARVDAMLVEDGFDAHVQIRLLELATGKVDGDGHRNDALLEPGANLPARGFQDPLADGNDEAAFLEDGNESRGRYVAQLGVVPPEQRLDTGDGAGRKLGLGLILQKKLVPFQGAAQVIAEVQSLERARVHLGRVELEAAAPELLRAVHRDVGVAQQRVAIRAVGRIRRNAHADCHEDFVAVDLERLLECGHDLLRDRHRLVGRGKIG